MTHTYTANVLWAHRTSLSPPKKSHTQTLTRRHIHTQLHTHSFIDSFVDFGCSFGPTTKCISN